MMIGGFQPFSCVDFPGKTCAIVFTSGCNFRCPYCHNPELVLPKRYAKLIDEKAIFRFLEMRKGLLDGVCVTGGEPTIQPDLPEFLARIRSMGFSVKLDTNGGRPEMLRRILDERLADYLAMDVKAPPDKYRTIVGFAIAPETIRTSIRMIIDSGIEHEFRTTVVSSLTSLDDLLAIGHEIRGAQRYYLQRFVPSKACDPDMLNASSYSREVLQKLAQNLCTFIERCDVR